MSDSEVSIFCALPLEASLLQAGLPAGDWTVAATGLGMDRTRRRLLDLLSRERPRRMIFTGSAGGLDPTLPTGTVVFPEQWKLEDGSVIAPDPILVSRLRARGWAIAGTGCTLRRPAIEAARRARLFRDLQAVLCDMEAAAALQTAARFQVPAIAVKVIADSVRDPTPASSRSAFETRLRAVIPKLVETLAKLLGDVQSGGWTTASGR